MSITASDLQHREFRKVFRGYDVDEVGAFLAEVSGTLRELTEKLHELEKKNIELESQLANYRSLEKSLQQTLVQTQESSARMLDQSRKEGHLLIQEAGVKASRILENARAEYSKLKEQVIILKTKKESIVTRLKLLLGSELELVKALEVDEDIPSATPENESAPATSGKNEIEEIIKHLNQ